MKGTNLTHNQIIAIGIAALFGIPTCVGLVVGHFLGFWLGVVLGGLVLLFIVYITRRWAERTNKQEKKE